MPKPRKSVKSSQNDRLQKSNKSFMLIGNGKDENVEELEEMIQQRNRKISLDNKFGISYNKVAHMSLLTNSDPDMMLSFSKDIAHIFGLKPNEKLHTLEIDMSMPHCLT